MTSGDASYKFVYDYTAKFPSILEEKNGFSVNYVREPDGSLICRNVGSNFNFYHFDQQGSTLFLTGGTGLVTDTYVYDAWGNMVSQTGSTLQPFKYVGRYGYYAHYQDDNVMPYPVVTGSSSSGIPGNTALSFIQTGVRTYFPRLGRYMQVDPARHGINWVMYCNDNPTNYIDPTGKKPSLGDIDWSGIRDAIEKIDDWREKAEFIASIFKCIANLSIVANQVFVDNQNRPSLTSLDLTNDADWNIANTHYNSCNVFNYYKANLTDALISCAEMTFDIYSQRLGM